MSLSRPAAQPSGTAANRQYQYRDGLRRLDEVRKSPQCGGRRLLVAHALALGAAHAEAVPVGGNRHAGAVRRNEEEFDDPRAGQIGLRHFRRREEHVGVRASGGEDLGPRQPPPVRSSHGHGLGGVERSTGPFLRVARGVEAAGLEIRGDRRRLRHPAGSPFRGNHRRHARRDASEPERHRRNQGRRRRVGRQPFDRRRRLQARPCASAVLGAEGRGHQPAPEELPHRLRWIRFGIHAFSLAGANGQLVQFLEIHADPPRTKFLLCDARVKTNAYPAV